MSGEYELTKLNYFKDGDAFVVTAGIRYPNGETESDVFSSEHNVFEAVFGVIDLLIRKTSTPQWRFIKYEFQKVGPRRRGMVLPTAKCLVYVCQPQGDGFCGQYADNDLATALGMAYINAINSLMRGRVQKEQLQAVS